MGLLKAHFYLITLSSIFFFLIIGNHLVVSQAQILPPPTPLLVAKNDSASTNEDTAAKIRVLDNDSYIGLGKPAVISITAPSNGNAVINSDNTITYNPTKDWFGAASFKYTVSDGIVSDTASVSVSVVSVNDNPNAVNDSATTDEDNSVTVNVLSNDSDVDGDSLVISSATPGSNGSTVITAGNAVTYTPNPNYNGQDSFSYTVSDGHGGQGTSNVFITINPVADFAITKLQSGLIAFDPLNNETKTRQELEASQSYWRYGGSAFSYFNPPAPTDLFKDSQGLHLGVQTPTNGTYAGYYAVVAPSNATLFHAKISTPVRTISGDFFQNGLYVQTSDGRINYVTCVSITSTAGTSWHIIRTFGDVTHATDFEVLWSDLSSNQPLTRDCTIITNGNNYLKVYLDGTKVYENNMIDLQMPGPFLYFLEPQNSHAQMLYGVYDDYYTAKGETIRVTDIPPIASRIDVVDSSGNVLATAPVSNSTVTLDVGMYHFPLAASIKVYGSANTEIISSIASIFGGDTYAITQ